MGYTVPDLTDTRNYVIANGVALLLAYIVTPITYRQTTRRSYSPWSAMKLVRNSRDSSSKGFLRTVESSTGSGSRVAHIIYSRLFSVAALLPRCPLLSPGLGKLSFRGADACLLLRAQL